MSEFEFPKVHVRELVKGEDADYLEPRTPPVCDFCFDRRVRWEYDCEDFDVPQLSYQDVPGSIWGSTGEWAACDFCSGCIETKAWSNLIARVLRGWGVLGKEITPEVIEDCGRIVFGFVDHYKPGRRAFG